MKVKTKSFMISVLMLIAFVFGVFAFMPTTTMAKAESGDGLTEATAKVVTNYAEFESAMEDSSIVFVKIDSNIDSAIQKSGSGIDVGAMVAGKKVLIVNATAEFYGYTEAQSIDSLLYVQDGDDLTIKGDGTLRFVPNANSTFNSVVRIEGGTVIVNGNVTIEGYTGAENYANAITNLAGNLNLLKGTCKGTLRVDNGNTNNFAVVDLQGGNTVIDDIAVSATVSHDGENESEASAMRISASVNSVVIQGGTFEKVNNYSIAVDSSKVIANYVQSGIKMYDASTHTEVSDYDEIYTTAQNVYFANAPQNAITSLALGTNKIVSGTKVSDLALTTYDTEKCTLGTYFVMNGLNKGLGDTGTAFKDADTLNPEYDCSAIYAIYAKDGKTFAPDFSVEDITFTNGVVTNVGNYGNAINVFVNFPKQTPEEPDESVITSLTLGTNKIVSGTKVSDLALTTYDTEKCILGTYFVMNGLDKGLGDTGNAFLSTDTLNPQYDCSAIYNIKAKDGFTFASDFSAEDITFTNGVVTKVDNYSNQINVFVNFPKQEVVSTQISKVEFTATGYTYGGSIDDFNITIVTPNISFTTSGNVTNYMVTYWDGYDDITVDTFGNREHEIAIAFKVDDGYEKAFAKENVFLNGQSATGWRASSDKYIAIFEFDAPTHTCVGSKVDGQGATCTADGWKDYYQCTICEKLYTDVNCSTLIADLAAWKVGDGMITSEGHKYGAWVSNGDGTHTRTCSVDNNHKENGTCSGGNSATCTTKKTCEYCNTAYGDFGAHDFTGVTLTEEIPATCVSTGTKAHKDCTVCHKPFADDGITEIADLTIPTNDNHDMATEWTGVPDGHYYECKRVGCDYHTELQNHNADRPAATEEHAKICQDCGYIIEAKLGHTCGSGVIQNGQGVTCEADGWKDYYKCSGCEKLYEDEDCTILIADLAAWKNGDGKITSEGHKFGAWVSNGDGTHTRTCSVDNSHKENGTCSGGTQTCTDKAICSTCNTEYGDTLTHSHGSAWETDENNHWNECVCGDKANVGTHADSDNNGKCDVCDYDMPTTPGGGSGSETPEKPDEPKDGLGVGAIIGIVVGGVAVVGIGGFALVWFVIKKKTWAEFLAIFKKK